MDAWFFWLYTFFLFVLVLALAALLFWCLYPLRTAALRTQAAT